MKIAITKPWNVGLDGKRRPNPIYIDQDQLDYVVKVWCDNINEHVIVSRHSSYGAAEDAYFTIT